MTNNVLEKIKGKLIVSCQARPGWPMYGPEIMAAFAKAAEEGGASGIRATGPDNIKAIKEKVDLPIIGIHKIFGDYPVYITPTYESAKEILDVGIDIIALDATMRKREGDESPIDIARKIHENYPDVLVMGEISTIDEAKYLLQKENDVFDLISCTLCGYTEESKRLSTNGIDLVRQIHQLTDKPVIAEGKIKDGDDAVAALEAGAYAVVVGTAITRPEIITTRFVEAISDYQKNK